MGSFGWKSPFPLRLGGSGHASVENLYNSIRANTGTALSDEEDTATVAEDKAFARALHHADMAIERYREQSDPRNFTQILERWEAILGLGVSSTMTDSDRRSQVAARLLANTAATSEGVNKIALQSFYPWQAWSVLTDLSSAVLCWPGGTTLTGYPWYSTIANVCIEYVRPAAATQDEVDTRRSACAASLEEWLPAWATYTLSETQSAGAHALSFGFYLDQPNLDVSAFGV